MITYWTAGSVCIYNQGSFVCVCLDGGMFVMLYQSNSLFLVHIFLKEIIVWIIWSIVSIIYIQWNLFKSNCFRTWDFVRFSSMFGFTRFTTHTVGMTVPLIEHVWFIHVFGSVRFHCTIFCDNLCTSSIGESTIDSDVII